VTIKSEWGMCCPRCGEDDELFVTVTVEARLVADLGTDPEGHQEWDDASRCRCGRCGWAGLVATTKGMSAVPEVPASIASMADDALGRFLRLCAGEPMPMGRAAIWEAAKRLGAK
jgi:hypothetical protein